MKRLILQRDDEDAERTFGKFYVGKTLLCDTMEPGAVEEYPRVDAGFYHCVQHGWEANSVFKYKQTWALVGADVSHQPEFNVRRAAILFHSGQRDEHTLGCILTGFGRGITKGEPSILNRYIGEAMDRLRQVIGRNQFYLTIKDK